MDVEREVAALDAMGATELRARWIALGIGPVPRISPRLMRLALAWELQARAFGGLSRDATRRLDQLARGSTRTEPPRAGMRLARAWGGKVHVVTIEPGVGGAAPVIRWDDRTWRSLSEVARAITGTRWSGPAFFGLKTKAAA